MDLAAAKTKAKWSRTRDLQHLHGTRTFMGKMKLWRTFAQDSQKQYQLEKSPVHRSMAREPKQETRLGSVPREPDLVRAKNGSAVMK
jgi:hypothetical protein